MLASHSTLRAIVVHERCYGHRLIMERIGACCQADLKCSSKMTFVVRFGFSALAMLGIVQIVLAEANNNANHAVPPHILADTASWPCNGSWEHHCPRFQTYVATIPLAFARVLCGSHDLRFPCGAIRRSPVATCLGLGAQVGAQGGYWGTICGFSGGMALIAAINRLVPPAVNPHEALAREAAAYEATDSHACDDSSTSSRYWRRELKSSHSEPIQGLRSAC